jgi:apolipoprotein N-acyltransferase
MADIAWCALVPFLLAAAYVQPSRSWRLGWVAGATFWLITLFWLTRVTYFGWFLLSLYCGSFMIPVALVASWWLRRFGVERFPLNALFMVVITAVWVSFEYIRFILFTGFPWNPLGASLHENLAFIQHARWGGVHALSALLVWANAALAVTLLRYLKKQARFGRRPHTELMLGMTVIVLAFVMGGRMLHDADRGGRDMRIALIQPSIPQDEKWTRETEDMIYERLRDLTTAAVVFTRPDLVVWPETALPYDVRINEACYELVDGLSRLGVPILVGTMDTETLVDRKPRYYNSSFLFDTNGVILETYDKRHLVLFGEYLPLHEHITFITAMTPIMESFSPGATSAVFRLPDREFPFSTLICFEDTLAYLARASVRNGARLLINQTNDAWFDPLWASRQHMVLSIFRAVENGVPMVRAANTGYSCAIDASGRVREVLVGENGRHDGLGFQLVSVRLPPDDMPLTFYTRHGDVFAWACLPIGLIALVFARKAKFI